MTFANRSEYCQHLAEIKANGSEAEQSGLTISIAHWQVWLTVAAAVPAVIVTPVVTLWSDMGGGRRRPLVFNAFFAVISLAIYLTAMLTFTNVNVYVLIMISTVVSNGSGGAFMFFVLTSTMIYDEVREGRAETQSTVPIRVAILVALSTSGSLMGTAVATILRLKFGTRAYLICVELALILSIVTFIYIVFCVKETLKHVHVVSLNPADSAPLSRCGRLVHLCRTAFVAIPAGLVSVCTAPRAGWTRFCLNVSLASMVIEYMVYDNNLLFLITKAQPFAWSDVDFLYYSMYKGVLVSIGSVLFPMLMYTTKFRAQDALMIVVGTFASMVVNFLISFSITTPQVWCATSLVVVAAAMSPGLRSLNSRMVKAEETARLYTAIGIVLNIFPIGSTAVYSAVYAATVEWWPSAAFAGSATLLVFPFVAQIIVYWLMRAQDNMAPDDDRRIIIVEEELHAQVVDAVER